ncbi:MAG: hypothetical protein DHS20C18_08130 [Saprospiraceae bacterium]|nr:MAG: hypothetical protein DHS20C18_08130 [Saprospiraceae bacterium]
MAQKKGFKISDLGSMPSEFILKNLVFLVFLGFLAMTYIANSHYAERNVRKIQVLQKEMRDMRWFYMSLESENMVNSMQSIVEDRVEQDGLKLYRGSTSKIVVGQNKR